MPDLQYVCVCVSQFSFLSLYNFLIFKMLKNMLYSFIVIVPEILQQQYG